jgi:hypothetical protein
VKQLRRALAWLAFVAVLELVTRSVVYGLAPTPDAASRELGGRLGGPGFVTVLVVALGLAAVLSAGLVWLAALGVRERWALAEDRPAGGPPRVSVAALLARAVALTLAGWLTFAAVETAIHLHEGLGFHGLECLVGPVHRNALPVVAALALLASALVAAAQVVLAWMRRTVGRFARPRPASREAAGLPALPFSAPARRAQYACCAPARGPPLPVV